MEGCGGGREKRFLAAAVSEMLWGEGGMSEADSSKAVKSPPHHFLKETNNKDSHYSSGFWSPTGVILGALLGRDWP